LNKLKRIKRWLYGSSLTQLMKQKGTNKYRVAKGSGISYQSLLNWTAGRCKPTDKSALAVAAYLGLISDDDQVAELERQAEDIKTRLKGLK